MSSYKLNPFSVSDALYCDEHWDYSGEMKERNTRNCFEKGGDFLSNNGVQTNPFVEFFEQKKWEDEELGTLLLKEQANKLFDRFDESSSLLMARSEAVEWILKVVEIYSFSAVTAIFAVNYLDRFLHSFHSLTEKPWMAQLAAVACLSLAAKVEETQVPLLLDLQVESKYLFESKTIQRMEILVLSTLKWKMNPITPHSFLEYIARKLGIDSHLSKAFLRRCQHLHLSIISCTDPRFIHCLPSALATAIMLHVLPDSPNGVIDVSFSSECSYDSYAETTMASVSSSPEPMLKKTKSQSPNH